MKKILIAIIIILFGSQCIAMHTALFGGYRDGLALGLIMEKPFVSNVVYRFGIEGTTGQNHLLMFVGVRDYLLTSGAVPISLRLSLLGYFGNNSALGGSFSFIFDNINNNKQLFFETGLDLVGSAKAMAQFGYKFGQSWEEQEKPDQSR